MENLAADTSGGGAANSVDAHVRDSRDGRPQQEIAFKRMRDGNGESVWWLRSAGKREMSRRNRHDGFRLLARRQLDLLQLDAHRASDDLR